MEEKFISALEEIKHPEIRDGYSLQSWKSKAINLVTRIYGANSKQEEQINLIRFKAYPIFGTASTFARGQSKVSGGGNNSEHCITQAIELIEGFITDIKDFGIPEKKITETNEGINITVNQSQTQSINLNIIIEAMQNELNGKQLNEVQKIIEQDLDQDSKKNKLFEKLKSFGSDVATNIIASILTNPAIYG